MAYFHCLIGGGSSGGGYELTVTCDADFAGTTITCTDGVTTLTQTCPSASPYEVVFELPNGGDWTISGVVSGQTVSTGVNIPTSASLIATVQQTVTIYSAKEDTISYTDIDGATQTITFASGETSKQVTITINLSGSSITFTSSVAKNPNNLSQDYSKTFTITTSTTDIYLMPDAVKTLYWWGYESDNLEDVTTANGWTSSMYTLNAPTYNKNNIYCNASGAKFVCIAKSNILTSGMVIKGITEQTSGSVGSSLISRSAKNMNDSTMVNTAYNSSLNVKETLTLTLSSDLYITSGYGYNRTGYIYALWYE
jgi:hypothetical protein